MDNATQNNSPNTSADSYSEKTKQYLTVRKLVEKYSFVTSSSIRWYIFHGAQNGFNKCIRRLGRKILIDEQAFFAWVDSNGGGNA
jgi:hypothetical protein